MRFPIDRLSRLAAGLCLVARLFAQASAPASRPAPIVHRITVADPEARQAQVEAVLPASGQAAVEVRMARWSPGFYRVENHARHVQDLGARTVEGAPLPVEKTRDNRWRITTNGANRVVLEYRLECRGRSVTSNEVAADYAVFHGPATFVTLVEDAPRPHEVLLELPADWPRSATALPAAPGGRPHHYTAPDFDVLADSPIVAGKLEVRHFDVLGVPHALVDFGRIGNWDAALAAQRIAAIAAEHGRFLGALPFDHYLFLNAHRPGGGGLEHAFSMLLTTGPGTTPTVGWLEFVSHEYFHAINIKRLRPIELGPFDYEEPPRTAGLWISEGLTTYFGNLAVARSGVGTEADLLASLSGLIRQLQTAPGRRVQTLADASLGVWTQSTSGVGGNPRQTVSYYVKGPVVGWLLDARIRRLSEGRRCLDDLMRLAFQRWSGARGFRREEFEAAAGEVAGADLAAFFDHAIRSTEELDYQEALDWFGLQFAAPVADPAPATRPRPWTLLARPDASEAQRAHRRAWLSPSRAR